jgi:hypothetical protein
MTLPDLIASYKKKAEERRIIAGDKYGAAEKKYPNLYPRDDFNAGYDSRQKDIDVLLEIIEKQAEVLVRSEGFMFDACQPSRGDLFAEWDEACGLKFRNQIITMMQKLEQGG